MLRNFAAGDRFTWSPRADVLAVFAYAPVTQCATGCPPRSQLRTTVARGNVDILTPTGRVERLPGTLAASGVSWSNSGRYPANLAYDGTLAFANWNAEREAVLVSRVRPRESTSSLATRVASGPGGQVAFAAFTPHGAGILYWSGDELSASAASDGQELRYQSSPNASSVALVEMLPTSTWLSFSPDGGRAVIVQGGGREAWHGKSLAVCSFDRRARCRTLPQPASAISLDAHWSPVADRIAFVRARDIGPNGAYGSDLRPFEQNFVNARSLWITNADGSRVRALARFGYGVYWPRWSRDGRSILAFRDGALWLGSSDGSVVKRVISGLTNGTVTAVLLFSNHGVVDDAAAPFAWTGSYMPRSLI